MKIRKKYFSRYWNGKILGLFSAIYTILSTLIIIVYEKIYSRIILANMGEYGKGCIIQKNITIRYPGNVYLGSNVQIGRNVEFGSEFMDSILTIESDVQINRNSVIDFSGNLIIKKRVLISDNVKIFTHSHGYNPRSIPKKKSLVIEEDVWIGSNSIIMENVEIICRNSLIASGAVVTKDVPENTIVGGNPAKVIGERTL